jgi:hypothetical protein
LFKNGQTPVKAARERVFGFDRRFSIVTSCGSIHLYYLDNGSIDYRDACNVDDIELARRYIFLGRNNHDSSVLVQILTDIHSDKNSTHSCALSSNEPRPMFLP